MKTAIAKPQTTKTEYATNNRKFAFQDAYLNGGITEQ
jgi:hypothetical protein